MQKPNRLYFLLDVFLLILGSALALSCKDKDKTANERTMKETAELHQIEDVVEQMKPNALNLTLQKLNKSRDSFTYYDYYLVIAKYYLLSSSPDSMIPYVEKTLSFTKRQKESPRLNGLIAQAYELKANYYHHYRKKQNATIRLRTIAYRYMLKSDNQSFLPDICANMADSYLQNNDIPNAAAWYRRALFLVDSLKLPTINNVSLYMGLGQIYVTLHDDSTALHYYQKTGKYFDQMIPSMRSYYLNNFGNYYYYNRDYKNALTVFLRMKKVLCQSGMEDNFDMYLCYINLADVYLNLNQLKLSRFYLSKAENFFLKMNVEVGIYYAHTIRIGLAVKEGDPNVVKEILLHEKIKGPIDQGLMNIRNRYLCDYYKGTGNYHKAFESLAQSIVDKDSVDKARGNMRASEIMMRFTSDTLSLHKKLTIEEKESEVKTSKARFWLTLGASLILSLILLCWIVYSRKRRLESQMNIMQLKLANIRSRISPHFIFNVLNNEISHIDKKEADELMKLVKLIRANLTISKDMFISLKEELDFVEYFVSVERTILGDEFNFSIQAPEDDVLRKIIVPSMFVQILVENAIKHGLKEKDGYKQLTITVVLDKNNAHIFIRDNGRGFDITRVNKNSTKTGLNVIRQTLLVINEHHKNKVKFNIHNLMDADGHVDGCESVLDIPQNGSRKR
jgi:two-component sensor histidine kinase